MFGSIARGAARGESDIDIAVLSDAPRSPYDLFLLAQEAAALVDREVDLVDLAATETVFRAQILSTGRLIANRDLDRVASFQMRAFKDYALLNEERACIMDAIQSRGSLYAK